MKRFNQALCKLLEVVVMVCVAAMVIVVLWGVFSRFVIKLPSRWTEELAANLLTCVALLGAAVAFRQRQHLGVDFFFAKLDPDARRINSVVIQVLIVIFATCVMIWGGINLVAETWAKGQVLPALGWPVWLTYLPIPISGLAIVLFAVEEIVAWLKNSGSAEALESPQRSE